MTQVKERSGVRTPPEGDTSIREAPPTRKEERRARTRRRLPWMALVMAFVALVAGLVLALLATGGSETTDLQTVDPGTPDYSLIQEYRDAPAWAADLGAGDGTVAVVDAEPAAPIVPMTADGAEGWFRSLEPTIPNVPMTADGAEGWFRSLEPTIPNVPATADGAEGWLKMLEPAGVEVRG